MVIFWGQIWEWMKVGGESISNGENLRNIALILAGCLGILLSLVGIFIALRRNFFASKSLTQDRYHRSAEMLSSQTVATRIGGVHALEDLARKDPETYHFRILTILCAFLRNDSAADNKHHATGEYMVLDRCRYHSAFKAAAAVIGSRSVQQIQLEGKRRIDLHKADLREARLHKASLSRVNLNEANLTIANLSEADLTGADLICAALIWTNLSGADLSGADLRGADLRGTNLEGAYLRGVCLSGATFGKYIGGRYIGTGTNLTNADFRGDGSDDQAAKGLTKEQIESAVWNRALDPPKLPDYLKDVDVDEMGEPPPSV